MNDTQTPISERRIRFTFTIKHDPVTAPMYGVVTLGEAIDLAHRLSQTTLCRIVVRISRGASA